MEQDYLISNKTYDVLKRFVTLVMPATATLYAALAALWDLPNPEAVVGTIVALTTFCGVLLAFSSNSWNNSEGKYDGEIVVGSEDEVTGNPDIQLTVTRDPAELAEKRTVRLRSIDAR
jgi:hypothetical protein